MSHILTQRARTHEPIRLIMFTPRPQRAGCASCVPRNPTLTYSTVLYSLIICTGFAPRRTCSYRLLQYDARRLSATLCVLASSKSRSRCEDRTRNVRTRARMSQFLSTASYAMDRTPQTWHTASCAMDRTPQTWHPSASHHTAATSALVITVSCVTPSRGGSPPAKFLLEDPAHAIAMHTHTRSCAPTSAMWDAHLGPISGIYDAHFSAILFLASAAAAFSSLTIFSTLSASLKSW